MFACGSKKRKRVTQGFVFSGTMGIPFEPTDCCPMLESFVPCAHFGFSRKQCDGVAEGRMWARSIGFLSSKVGGGFGQLTKAKFGDRIFSGDHFSGFWWPKKENQKVEKVGFGQLSQTKG